jgi:hypothetical protein
MLHSAAAVAVVFVAGCADILGFGPSLEVDIRHIATAPWGDGTAVHLLEYVIKNDTKEPIQYPVCSTPNPLTWEMRLMYVPDFTVQQRVESSGAYEWEDVHRVCQLGDGGHSWGLHLETGQSRRDTALARVSGRVRAVLPLRSFDGSTWSQVFTLRSNEISLP